MLWKSFREFAAANPKGTLEEFRSRLASSVQHCERTKLAELARLLSLVAGYIEKYGKSKTVSSLISLASDVHSEQGAKIRSSFVEDGDVDEEDPVSVPSPRRELLGGLQSRRFG